MSQKQPQGRRLVPETRGAFLRALKIIDEKGVPLSDLLAQSFEDEPLRTLDTMSKFVPKEMLLAGQDDESGEPVPFTIQILPIESRNP